MNLFLQTAGANWLSFQCKTHYNIQHSPPIPYSPELITPNSLLTANLLQTDAGYCVGRHQLPQCLISNLKWPKASTFLPPTSQSVQVRDDVRKRKDVGRGVKNNTLTLQNKDSDTQYVRLIQSIQSYFSEGALASETVKDNIALLV